METLKTVNYIVENGRGWVKCELVKSVCNALEACGFVPHGGALSEGYDLMVIYLD